MPQDLRNIGQTTKKSWREKIKELARQLRKNQTESEKIVWKLVRNRKINGIKFLRQHPITYDVYQRPYFFIADFYCAEKNLILEIDGKLPDYQEDYDEQRTFLLNKKGIKVVRIKNKETEDIDKLIEKIKAHLE